MALILAWWANTTLSTLHDQSRREIFDGCLLVILKDGHNTIQDVSNHSFVEFTEGTALFTR
jgi:hypothetical protein